MKDIIITLFAIIAVSTAMVVINTEGQDTPHLLGDKACTWGPTYWCQNLTTAAKCPNATKYCIPRVWSKMTVPEDNDSVCQICKDMVQQARDQLESNQTQEDLKAVFEGSCALIHIKSIVKECDRLVDQFIPELVETLASQMNPSVVCSVAGLCNSARIDKLLLEHEQSAQQVSVEKSQPLDECSNCYTIATHIENKFNQQSRDHVLEEFLNICGQLSSFSDACSSIVLTNFETIYEHLEKNLIAKNICHISGQCSNRYHVHEDKSRPTPNVEIRPLSVIGKVEIGDDLPCKLCEQLVGHLRDLLIANTTETEFETVLEGLCKQTKSFASECKAIVQEYYPQIYNFLINGLDGNAVCQMAGICPPRQKIVSQPISPLIPESAAKIGMKILNNDNEQPLIAEIADLHFKQFRESILGISMIDSAQCETCELILHRLQKSIKDVKNKNEVELKIQEVKDYFASSQHQEISSFLNKYDIAILELITEGKDFSEICSLVAVCATRQQIEAWEQIPSNFKQIIKLEDKPNCPLCLTAVEELYGIIQKNRTEANIMSALNQLCSKLPKKLNEQCQDFVKAYGKELLTMLLQDLSPEEVCIYLKLCPNKNTVHESLFKKVPAVPTMDVKGKETCALCEYILHYLQQIITDPKADDEVKQMLEKVCRKLPKSILNDCNEFVDMYGDAVVAIIAQEIDPADVCPMIHLCPSAQLLEEHLKTESSMILQNTDQVEDKPNCPLCLLGIEQLYNMIKNNKTEESIHNALDKLCSHLAEHLVKECDVMVDKYSKQIVEAIIADFTPQEICVYLKLCDAPKTSEAEITFYPLDGHGEIMSNDIPNFPVYIVDNQESDDGKVNDAECDTCKIVLKYIVKVVDNRKSKDEIEKALHDVCGELPNHMKQKCNSFVDQYAELVIELITQDMSPEKVCEELKLCNPQPQDNEVCSICETMIKEVEIIITNPKYDVNIEKELEKICDRLQPASRQEQCKTVMQSYEHYVINAIRLRIDPKLLCKKLGFCQTHAPKKLLGSPECTYGPSYWCQNEENARKCKALKYCQDKHLLPKL